MINHILILSQFLQIRWANMSQNALTFCFLLAYIFISATPAQSCSFSCESCINSICVTCYSEYSLYNNECVISCPDQYYQAVSTAGGYICQPRTTLEFIASLLQSHNVLTIGVEMSDPVNEALLNFTGLARVWIDDSNHVAYQINHSSASNYTITLTNISKEAVLDRNIYIDVSQINDNPEMAYSILTSNSVTNITIPGKAGEDTNVKSIGRILGIFADVFYGVAILLALIQNIKSCGANSNLLVVLYYTSLFQLYMMLNVNYAPNLTEYYSMLPNSLWSKTKLFHYIFAASNYTVEMSPKQLPLSYQPFIASPRFVINYGLVLFVLILLLVTWITIVVIQKIGKKKKKNYPKLNKLQKFLENNFLSILGGTMTLSYMSFLLDLQYVWIADTFSWVSLVIAVFFGIVGLYMISYLIEVSVRNEGKKWETLKAKAEMLTSGFSKELFARRILLGYLFRSFVSPMLVICLGAESIAQAATMLGLNAGFTVVLMVAKAFNSERLALFARFNEALQCFILSLFLLLAVNVMRDFMTPDNQIAVAWLIVVAMLFHSLSLAIFQCVDFYKEQFVENKKKKTIGLSDEETASQQANKVKSEVNLSSGVLLQKQTSIELLVKPQSAPCNSDVDLKMPKVVSKNHSASYLRRSIDQNGAGITAKSNDENESLENSRTEFLKDPITLNEWKGILSRGRQVLEKKTPSPDKLTQSYFEDSVLDSEKDQELKNQSKKLEEFNQNVNDNNLIPNLITSPKVTKNLNNFWEDLSPETVEKNDEQVAKSEEIQPPLDDLGWERDSVDMGKEIKLKNNPSFMTTSQSVTKLLKNDVALEVLGKTDPPNVLSEDEGPVIWKKSSLFESSKQQLETEKSAVLNELKEKVDNPTENEQKLPEKEETSEDTDKNKALDEKKSEIKGQDETKGQRRERPEFPDLSAQTPEDDVDFLNDMLIELVSKAKRRR